MEDPVSGSYAMPSEIPSYLAEKVLKTQSSDPVEILKEYQSIYMRGRPLDISHESVVIEGETCSIFVSRGDIFQDAIEELQHLENLRYPLEVNFHGENAEDYGGPRREFFELILTAIKEKLVSVSNGIVTLHLDEEALARYYYYYAGITIGLSAIQGGPLADFLDQLLQSPESEQKDQFVRGLEKTGLIQLMRGKRTRKFLFRRIENIVLTVQKFIKTFDVRFSEEGANRRRVEETIYRQFLKYVRDVYAGRQGDKVSLENILAFVTGTREIPVLGYAIQPTIVFQLEEGRFPTATTCINRLLLPSEVNFEMYDLAFLNTHFGLN